MRQGCEIVLFQIKRKRQSIASKTWLLKLQAEWKFVLLCFLRVSLCRVDHGIEMVPQWGFKNGKKVHQIMRTNKISYNFRIPKFYEIFQTPAASRLEYIFPRICGYRNTQRLESKFVWIFFFTPQTSSWPHHFKLFFRKTQLFEANRA